MLQLQVLWLWYDMAMVHGTVQHAWVARTISALNLTAKRGFKLFGPRGEPLLAPLAGASLLASLSAAGAAGILVAPQAGPNASALGALPGRRELRPGAATPRPVDEKRPPSPGGAPAATPPRARQHGGVRFCRAATTGSRAD